MDKFTSFINFIMKIIDLIKSKFDNADTTQPGQLKL